LNNCYLVKSLFILIPVILLFPIVDSFSQCKPAKLAFQSGESIIYDAYYNWGLIWVQAGEINFKVSETKANNQELFEFSTSGNTLSSYEWLYKVHDKYTSTVNKENFRPLKADRNTYEGGYFAYEKYNFNYKKGHLYSQVVNSKKAITTDTLTLKSCMFDVLSAVYYVRCTNFSNMKKNETLPFAMVIDGQIFNTHLRFLGRETITDKQKRTYKAIKFSALLMEGTIFKGGEDLFVWVTDDENHLPILIEAKILIGAVKGYLRTSSGLKYPMTSLISTGSSK
jgi:hypothetical protein